MGQQESSLSSAGYLLPTSHESLRHHASHLSSHSSSSFSGSARRPRLDMRWSRLTMDQLRDEEFLTKQLRRMETLLGASARRQTAASSTGKSASPSSLAPSNGSVLNSRGVFVSAAPSRLSLQQRLIHGKSGFSPSPDDQGEDGAASENDRLAAAKQFELANGIGGGDVETEIRKELDLLNALYLFGELRQPELAALMLQKLKELLLRLCSFPDPFYDLLALRRYILRSVHEAVQVQHQHQRALVNLSVSTLEMLQNTIRQARMPQLLLPNSSRCGSSLVTTGQRRSITTTRPGGQGTGHTSSLGIVLLLPIKPKEKVAREASMGIQVVFTLFSSLIDQASTSLAQRKEILSELMPLIQSLPPQSLAPKSVMQLPTSSRGGTAAAGRSEALSAGAALGSAAASESQELVNRIQRFLLEICPAPSISKPGSLSPKVQVVASSLGDFDVTDRTNAVNALIYLAAARSSLRDFLLAIKVILGASDCCSETKDGHQQSSASLVSPRLPSPLTSSAPLLRAKHEDQHPVSRGSSEWGHEEEIIAPRRKSKVESASAVELKQLGASKYLQSTHRADPKTTLSSTYDLVNQVKRKVLPKGFVPKAIGSTTTSTTVNIALASHPVTHHHHHRYSSSPVVGAAGGYKSKMKEDMKEPFQNGNAAYSLDISTMQDSSSQDGFSSMSTSRLNRLVQTVRCPKLKPLSVSSVLHELDIAKISVPQKSTARLTTQPSQKSSIGISSGDFHGDNMLLPGEDECEDKEVWSCGQNSYGELGHGDTITRKSFDRIEALHRKDVVQVSAGNEHSIVLCGDGTVLTCGYNDNGQCGVGVTNRVSNITEIHKFGDHTIAQVHAYNGCEHSVVVTQDGRAATFGYNYRGQLGHGNTTSENVPKLIRSLEARIVRLVSCSYYHTILTCDEVGGGREYVYTFGRNDYGQLGHNDTIDRKVPHHIETLADQHIVSVACGQYHTMVVSSSGKAYGFGKNDYGQLGIDSLDNQLVPVQVRSGLEKHVCLEIRCGYYHSIVLCGGAHLFGFGRNDYGQLGLGKSNATPAANLQLQQQRFAAPQLVEELEGKEVIRFACGCYHTVAVSDSGMMYVFGRNNHGQLGTGDTTERLFPFPIEDFLGKRIAMVAAGFYHTIVLTGGKEEEKYDQDGEDNGDGDDESSADGQGLLSSSSILSAQNVRQILDQTSTSEDGEKEKQSEKKKTNRPDEETDSCSDPSWNPDEEDCRDEDDCRRRGKKLEATAESLAGTCHLQDEEPSPALSSGSGGVDSIDVAVIILAELDRLCKPYLPKHGVYPALQHPSSEAIQLLQLSIKTSSPSASFDVSGIFNGCFEAHVIHTCSSTFESLCILLRHLSGKKIEHLSRAHHHGSSQSSRSSIQGVSNTQLQVYILLVCVRLLQANLAQLLRSGLGKMILLVAHSRELGTNSSDHGNAAAELPSSVKELERMLVVIRQLRDSLMSLVDIKQRSSSISGSEADATSQDMTTKIASEAVETLMLGFELFFPCQCEQRRVFLCVIENHDDASMECCVCGGDTGKHPLTTETYPRSRNLLLSPLLRRMADDSLVVKCLPLAAINGITMPAMVTPTVSAKNKSLFGMTSVYTALLERIGIDFTRAIGGVAPVSGEMCSMAASGNARSAATTSSNSSLFNMVVVLQKHISTWAASCDRWVKTFDARVCDPKLSMKDKAAVLVDQVFRVDVHDVDDVPLPWRCFLEFTQAIISQSCDVFLQVISKESAPSPSFGHMSMHAPASHADNYLAISNALLEIVEASIVGQVLPSVISGLLVFSSNSLFAVTLLPHTKNLLHLLDDFNQRSLAIREIDKKLGQRQRSTAATTRSASSRGRSSLTSRIGLIRGVSDSHSAVGSLGPTIGEVISQPWSYLLEKEVSVLAAEMAVTLSFADPLFVFEASQDESSTSSLSRRWLSSPLFSGGLSSSFMRNSIKQSVNPEIAISDATRIVQHVPLQMGLKAEPAMTSDTRPFSLVLPPHRYGSENGGAQWTHSAQTPVVVHEDNYVDVLSGVSTSSFLDCMSGVRIGACCTQARALCDWVRAYYAKTNASYRMLTRQTKQPLVSMKPESANDTAMFQDESCVEYAAFAAILHHNQLTPQAIHFALSIGTGAPPSKPPPRVFLSLWHFVAELRRRFSAKKMEIKNSVSGGTSQDGDPSIAVARLLRTIVERCQLLLLVSIQDEEEHEHMMLDGGFIPPYNPPVFAGEKTSVVFSSSSSTKHMNSVYLDHQLPFLVAFPNSKWRKVRILIHVMTRWRWIGCVWQIKKKRSEVSSEILDFLTTDEPVSSLAAVNVLLVDPCRRASCAARGLESICEVLSIPSFESIQADVVHRFSQVVVFQSHTIEASLTRPKSPNIGLFFKEQYNAALSEFLTQVTKAIVQKSNALFASATTESAESDSASTCRSLVMLLSCWAIHFKVDHFEFVNNIGILSILQKISKRISKFKQVVTLPMSSSNIVAGDGDSQRFLEMPKCFDRLEDTLWVLSRHICAHFAVQATSRNEVSTGLPRAIAVGVPRDPVLTEIFALIFDQTLEISQSALGSSTRLATGGIEDATSKENIPETARLPSAATMRRSFEIIWAPKRFSSLSKGLSYTYEEMINPLPSGCSPSRPAMSPLVKPNEFSITTWVYTKSITDVSSSTGAPPMSSRLSPREQEPRFIFLRGNHREIAPYLILVPERDSNWHFELGLLINLRPEQPGGILPSASVNTSKYVVHERLVSKEAVPSGKWTHVAVVCEASKVRLYINGIMDTQRNLLPAHTSALSSASVDLPFHFGKFPANLGVSLASSSASSLSIHPVVPSLHLLASTLASKSPFSQNVDRCSSASEPDNGILKSFDGSLSNFRFHNRSLSPIHVRIVYDEKKQNASTSAGTPRTLVPAIRAEAHTHRKLLDQLAVLLLLSSSSEGLVHFTSHASEWLKLLWELFIKTDEFRVQQSVLRVLRVILPRQGPLVLYSVLVEENIARLSSTSEETPAALGFISKEDVFVQQIIRIIGFTGCKCPNNNVESSPHIKPQDIVQLPWTLMLPVGVHGNELAPPRDELKAANWNLQDDMNKQEHAASTQSLGLGNELVGLLHHLFASTAENSGEWRDSIQRTLLGCMTGVNAIRTFTQPKQLLRIGQRVVSLEIVKMVEAVGCFHVLSGVVDFMRPGAIIELTQAGDIAHIIAVEPSTSNTPASAPNLERSTEKRQFAYVSTSDFHRRSHRSSAFDIRPGWGEDAYGSWYDRVLNYSHLRQIERGLQSVDIAAPRSRYLFVNTEDIQPMQVASSSSKLPTSFVPSILYALRSGSEDFFTKLISSIANVCLQQIGSLVDEFFDTQNAIGTNSQLMLIWKQSSSLVMKTLVQASASFESAQVLLRDTALVDRVLQVSTSEDGNASFATCAEVERKVWLLRQRVYTVLIDLEDEGDAELQQLFQSGVASQRRPSEFMLPKAVENRAVEDCSVPEALKIEDESVPLKLSEIESRRTSRRRSEQKNDDEADEVEDADPNDEGLIRDDSSAEAKEEDDEPDEEEGDDDNDNEDDGELEEDEDERDEEEADEDEEDEDAEENRAEFVEELMLMGFPEEWCILALKQTENDIVCASAWIVDNLEHLSRLQTSLDKQRDRGSETSRFNEEEDDNVAEDGADGDTVSVSGAGSGNTLARVARFENGQLQDDEPSSSASKLTVSAKSSVNSVAPPLNDKEMARKVFGEMYFPFEEGGYRSNTRHCLMQSWRTEAVEMKLQSLSKSQNPLDSADVITPLSQDNLHELSNFRSQISQMELKVLVKMLQDLEQTLSILYARQCIVTLCHHTSEPDGNSLPSDETTPPFSQMKYSQFFQLLKMVLLRGNQFTVVVVQGIDYTAQQLLQERTPDQVLSSTIAHFLDRDFEKFLIAVLDFCVTEIEKAASNKSYDAHLWTQRDLKRADRTVNDEPAIEIVSWIVDEILKQNSLKPWKPLQMMMTQLIKRLRFSLKSANLPLKFLGLHMISVILQKISKSGSNLDLVQSDIILLESGLEMEDFLHAAKQRHAREVVQHRLIFSVYLQAYVEILHVLRELAGGGVALEDAKSGTICALSGDPFRSLSSPLCKASTLNGQSRTLGFDRKRCRSNLLTISDDGASVGYSGSEVWKTVFAAESFSTGVVSWQMRIEKSSSSYLFVGVGNQRASSDSFLGADEHSWGYIGDKALYYQRNRVKAYGDNFGEGDCIGVRLDCERGTLSFSKNGVDFGVAFDNIVGEVCPAVAFYSRHQRVSFVADSFVVDQESGDVKQSEDSKADASEELAAAKTNDDSGAPGSVEEALIVCELMKSMINKQPVREDILRSAFEMTTQWTAGSKKYVTTRSGKPLWVDVTRDKCSEFGFQSGERVRTNRGNGVVVGVAEQRLWVEVDGEQGAWFFHPSKLRSLTLISVGGAILKSSYNVAAGTVALGQDKSSSPSKLSSDVLRSSNPLDDSPSLPTIADSLSFTEFQGFVNDVRWSLSIDREIMNFLNDFCETSSVSPWNISPSEALDVLKQKENELENVMAQAGFNSTCFPTGKNGFETKIVCRLGFLRFFNAYFSRVIGYFDLTWHYFSPNASLLPCKLISKCRGSLFITIKNEFFTALMEKTANSPKKADDDYDYPEDLPQVLLNRPKAATAKCHPGSTKSLFHSLFGQAFEELHFLPLRTLRMVYSHPMDDGQLRSFKVKFEGEGVDDYGGPYREFFSQFFAELQMLRIEHDNDDDDGQDLGATAGLESKVEVTPTECLLPFLLPSPNWRNGVGANREKFVINAALLREQFHACGDADEQARNRNRHNKTSTSAANKTTLEDLEPENLEEKRQLHGEMFYFLGQMLGTCLRTRVCVRLDLAILVWKHLAGENEGDDDNNSDQEEAALVNLKEVDFVAYTLWRTLRGVLSEYQKLQSLGVTADHHDLRVQNLVEQLEAMDLTFTVFLSDGQVIELCENGANKVVTLDNLEVYLKVVLRARMDESNDVMNIIKQGLNSILPVTALSLFTWKELEKRVCGVAEVDVNLLKQNTEYDEDVSPQDEFVQRFWRVLAAMDEEDKRCFLRFVWARSRLPTGTAQFHQKFKIQSVASSSTGESGNGGGSGGSSTTSSGGWMDSQLPKSHTCFFALQLPRYSTDEICRKQLLYAVRNCVEMDGDFRLADTEMTGWSDIDPSDQLRF